MKILAVSDEELPFIYSPTLRTRFADVDFVISCGDLPHFYLEYIVSTLDRPLYFVRGNHAPEVELTTGGERRSPWGAVELTHLKMVRAPHDLLITGLEGSLRYNYGRHQYTQSQYWMKVWMLTPLLFLNRMLYGRYLDIFVTHAPPWKIHDKEDLPHQGIKAFVWLDTVFQPLYHLHGHIHIYRQDTPVVTWVKKTRVVNAFGYREIIIP